MTIDTKVNKSVTRPACDMENVMAVKQADKQELDLIHTTPGLTTDGKPFNYVVKEKVAKGEYRLETTPNPQCDLRRFMPCPL